MKQKDTKNKEILLEKEKVNKEKQLFFAFNMNTQFESFV